MAFHYEIKPDQQLVVVHMSGAATREEISASRAAVAADPLFKTGFSALIDLRELTSTEALTTADIQQLAASTIDHMKRRAFVVRDPAAYGLIRMYDSMRMPTTRDEEIRLFDNMADAEAWLGLPPRQ